MHKIRDMIKELDLNLLKKIYNSLMVKDFPNDELKPFEMIKTFIIEDKSIALGYYENDVLKGYATVLYAGNSLLLDYFAIISDYRGRGYGTCFLSELKDYFKNYDFLLIEAENNESVTARKRIEFYKRCGCRDSLLRGRLYFVEYVFLYLELSDKHNSQMIKEEIVNLYSIIYPHYLNTEYLIFH